MPRRWAVVHLEDGSVSKISRKAALTWVGSGDLIVVSRRPLIVRVAQHKNFDEEQRHLSGRKIPGVHKGIFNGKYSISSGHRARPPRSSINWDYVKTIELVRQAERKIEDDRDDEVAKQKRKAAARKAAKRRKRKIRRIRRKTGPQDGRH